jgi:single-stranded-DNA-specific exonuclease
VLGRPWRDRLDAGGEREALAIAQAHGVPDMLARVLAGRGVRVAEVASYLEPRLRDLMPDPTTIRDMDKAAERLADAVARKEHVAIFGDYDVDGACSAALLAGFLEAHGARGRIHIPDRIVEGYGPNAAAIKMLAAEGARLLVTVDCGTTSHEQLTFARELGMEVIVLDHHQAGVQLPEVTALVNPNRQDDLSGLGSLCAAGVVFVTLVAVARAMRARGLTVARDLMAELDIVALATVADVVPLTGLNRAFVRQGLKVMAARGRQGLRALMDVAGLGEPPAAYHLGFMLGPRINAGGRIGDAVLGARLLLCDDESESVRIAAELDRLNRERQGVEQEMLAEAEADALAQVGPDGTGAATVIVGSKLWHPGVVGLVASRLKERFRRPAFAIAYDEAQLGTGSARSIPGVDIGRAVRAAVEAGLIRKGGGHAMAAGITLHETELPAFRAFVEARIMAAVNDAVEREALIVDSALEAGGATPALFDDIERAGPYGQGNPEPVFVLRNHRLVNAAIVGEAHVRVAARSPSGETLNCIAFRAVGAPLGDALLARDGRPWHLAVTLSRNRRASASRIEGRIIDLAPAG